MMVQAMLLAKTANRLRIDAEARSSSPRCTQVTMTVQSPFVDCSHCGSTYTDSDSHTCPTCNSRCHQSPDHLD